jgi:peptidoglycan/xylan/chitin deacetylase (PgdA/CDA1 family)
MNVSTVVTPLVDNMQAWLDKVNTSVGIAESTVRSGRDSMVVTFSADDGRQDDIDELKPLFISKGVPLTLAIIANDYRAWDAAGLREMQDDYGWDISCHSWNHDRLGDLTEAQLVTNYEDCLNQFASDGIICQTVYYPFGDYGQPPVSPPTEKMVKEVTARYFRAGFGVGAGDATDIVNPILQQFQIRRFPLDTATLVQAKAHVDALVALGSGWCNFYMHSDTIGAGMGYTDLGLLIDYVKAQTDVQITNTADGLNVLGNVINIGNYDPDELTDPHYVVGAYGSYSNTTEPAPSPYRILGRNPAGYDADDLISAWEDGTISVATYASGDLAASGYPWIGTVVTHREAQGLGTDGIHWQELHRFDSTFRYKRVAVSDTAWDVSWTQVDA